jgi:hypothetical protein
MDSEPIKMHTDYSGEMHWDQRGTPAPTEKRVIDDEPLKCFETLPEKVKTELSQWMTFRPEDREKRVKKLIAVKEARPLRAEMLAFIIWFEAFHKQGNSKVAAIAFHGLFPDHLKADAR